MVRSFNRRGRGGARQWFVTLLDLGVLVCCVGGPAKVRPSADDLPAGTELVEVAGATHAFFGDYDTQSGDGTATVSRDDAQRQIQAASIALLDRVDALP